LELLSGSLDGGVGNEILPSDGCSPEDLLSKFGGEAGRSGKIKESDRDHLYFFYKTVMEFCSTRVRCNQICI